LHCNAKEHICSLNISEPNNGQNNRRDSRPKAEILAQTEKIRILGIALGNWREGARQCGFPEGRVT
jgi:hypothetical protein